MQAALYTRNGDPDVLTWGTVPDPAIGPTGVLVKVAYVSIEGGDLISRRMTPPANGPHVVGYQAAGTVVAIGEQVTRVAVGQKVCAFHWFGSHAELFAVDQRHAFPLPDGIDLAMASTVPTTFGTAHDALFEFAGLQPGETVLVQGAAGGVGIAAVQLAAQAGARVIATASGAGRSARLAEYGAAETIDHAAESVAERCLALTDGKGVDIVMDIAGGRAMAELMRAIRYRGRYLMVGIASGESTCLDFTDMVTKSLTCHGTLFGREMGTPRGQAIVEDLLRQMAAGAIRMPIDRVFPLSEAAAAHRYAEQAHPFGRVLMAA